MKISFIKFINKTPPIGKSIVCYDDLVLKKILKKIKTNNYLTYGFDKGSNYQITNVKYYLKNTKFDIKIKSNILKKLHIKNITLNLIGKHNVLNATASIAVCLNLGVKISVIKKALKFFSGVQRRLTKIFDKNGTEFYDDYAHHPTEIKSVLEGLRNVYKKRKIVSVFQPHRYSRVRDLKKEFANSFSKSDVVILCPLYPAGEKIDKKYKQETFANLIRKLSKKQVIIIKNQLDLIKYSKKNLINGEIVIGLGAGTISKWMRELKNHI